MIKYLFLLLLFEYLQYNYLLYSNNNCKYITPLFHFLDNCLITLIILIDNYFKLLEVMILMFLHFPTNIISIFGMTIALHYISIILKIILN